MRERKFRSIKYIRALIVTQSSGRFFSATRYKVHQNAAFKKSKISSQLEPRDNVSLGPAVVLDMRAGLRRRYGPLFLAIAGLLVLR